jgi:hypothetical protein
MHQGWEVLRTAGVPDGAVRRPSEGRLDPSSIAAAVQEVVADAHRLEAAERECLAAWLGAFQHHWPDRFAAILGSDGERALQSLGTESVDRNRYLKLRRIAIENLAALV